MGGCKLIGNSHPAQRQYLHVGHRRRGRNFRPWWDLDSWLRLRRFKSPRFDAASFFLQLPGNHWARFFHTRLHGRFPGHRGTRNPRFFTHFPDNHWTRFFHGAQPWWMETAPAHGSLPWLSLTVNLRCQHPWFHRWFMGHMPSRRVARPRPFSARLNLHRDRLHEMVPCVNVIPALLRRSDEQRKLMASAKALPVRAHTARIRYHLLQAKVLGGLRVVFLQPTMGVPVRGLHIARPLSKDALLRPPRIEPASVNGLEVELLARDIIKAAEQTPQQTAPQQATTPPRSVLPSPRHAPDMELFYTTHTELLRRHAAANQPHLVYALYQALARNDFQLRTTADHNTLLRCLAARLPVHGVASVDELVDDNLGKVLLAYEAFLAQAAAGGPARPDTETYALVVGALADAAVWTHGEHARGACDRDGSDYILLAMSILLAIGNHQFPAATVAQLLHASTLFPRMPWDQAVLERIDASSHKDSPYWYVARFQTATSVDAILAVYAEFQTTAPLLPVYAHRYEVYAAAVRALAAAGETALATKFLDEIVVGFLQPGDAVQGTASSPHLQHALDGYLAGLFEGGNLERCWQCLVKFERTSYLPAPSSDIAGKVVLAHLASGCDLAAVEPYADYFFAMADASPRAVLPGLCGAALQLEVLLALMLGAARANDPHMFTKGLRLALTLKTPLQFPALADTLGFLRAQAAADPTAVPVVVRVVEAQFQAYLAHHPAGANLWLSAVADALVTAPRPWLHDVVFSTLLVATCVEHYRLQRDNVYGLVHVFSQYLVPEWRELGDDGARAAEWVRVLATEFADPDNHYVELPMELAQFRDALVELAELEPAQGLVSRFSGSWDKDYPVGLADEVTSSTTAAEAVALARLGFTLTAELWAAVFAHTEPTPELVTMALAGRTPHEHATVCAAIPVTSDAIATAMQEADPVAVLRRDGRHAEAVAFCEARGSTSDAVYGDLLSRAHPDRFALWLRHELLRNPAFAAAHESLVWDHYTRVLEARVGAGEATPGDFGSALQILDHLPRTGVPPVAARTLRAYICALATAAFPDSFAAPLPTNVSLVEEAAVRLTAHSTLAAMLADVLQREYASARRQGERLLEHMLAVCARLSACYGGMSLAAQALMRQRGDAVLKLAKFLKTGLTFEAVLALVRVWRACGRTELVAAVRRIVPATVPAGPVRLDVFNLPLQLTGEECRQLAGLVY